MGKKLILVIAVVIFLLSNTKAQFKQGDFELAFTGSFNSITVKNNTSYEAYSYDMSETRTAANVSFSPGFYFLNNISIEAEIGISALENSKPSQYFLLNLSYTYLLPESKVGLFAHAGYGISNSVLITYNNALNQTSDEKNVSIFNTGGGVKYLITPNVIMRFEINYRMYNWINESDGYFRYKYDYKLSNVGLIFGFSILLPK